MTDPLTLLSTSAAADRLGLKPQTLRLWRLRGCGPAYIRLSGSTGRCGYRPADIDRWLADRTFTSTAAETVARASAH